MESCTTVDPEDPQYTEEIFKFTSSLQTSKQELNELKTIFRILKDYPGYESYRFGPNLARVEASQVRIRELLACRHFTEQTCKRRVLFFWSNLNK